MKINFYPDYDNRELIEACLAYKNLWKVNGKRIVDVIEEVTGLKFIEHEINAIIYNGSAVPFSNPLRLRNQNTDEQIKIGGLIHELTHRIFVGNKIKVNAELSNVNYSLEVHKQLDLVLYDIFVKYLDNDFANKIVDREKQLNTMYEQAWNYALSLTEEQRKETFDLAKEF